MKAKRSTCLDISISGKKLESTLEAPKTTLTTPKNSSDQVVVEFLQTILYEGDHSSDQTNDSNDKSTESYCTQIISYEISKSFSHSPR